ncbi:hypothetical protein Sjap_010693 [Stephania japonica]|uniref:Diacylglycerol kinase n=1 Tax=Stephania japonica TaxID=461633 RepID=A0AAP0J9W7_9MAGN
MVDDSSAVAAESTRVAARSSLVDSLRACGISGIRIDKQALKRRILIPEYIRLGIRDAILSKDPDAAAERHRRGGGEEKCEPAEAPVVVFVNSKSGGRHGPALKERLQELMGEEQVFDLSLVKPPEFVEFGLGFLEKMASFGDQCAKVTREKLRIMVAGGDGTAGWILGSLAELCVQHREPVPPTGIIPLGTGNDLSRSFGWGGSFPFAWRAAIKKYLSKAISAPVYRLDSWQVVVTMPDVGKVELPYCLQPVKGQTFDQDLDVKEKIPQTLTCYEGVFYNYFSIGMDAQVAYGFHHLRNKRPYLAQGPISNKLIYSTYSCTQGWFCTPCMKSPSLRGLKNILRMHIKKANCSEWEQVQMPSDVRAIVALNLHNYGSGRNPWGKLKPKYLEKKGFVEAHVDDGVIEIFGLKQGWHASFVLVDLITAKHIAQAFHYSVRYHFKSTSKQLVMDVVRQRFSLFKKLK